MKKFFRISALLIVFILTLAASSQPGPAGPSNSSGTSGSPGSLVDDSIGEHFVFLEIDTAKYAAAQGYLILKECTATGLDHKRTWTICTRKLLTLC